MKYAYSLASSSILRASDLINSNIDKVDLFNYAKRQYVCPECFQPVFPRGTGSNVVSPHFSHFEKGVHSPECLVRSNNNTRITQKKPSDFIKSSLAKGDYAHAYLCCTSAYILNSLSSIICEFCDNFSGKITSMKMAERHGSIDVFFTEKSPEFFFSSTEALSCIAGQKPSAILSVISDLVFPSDSNHLSASEVASCGHVLSPLLTDLLQSGGYFKSEEFAIPQEVRSELLGIAYENLANTSQFKSLRSILIFSALAETFLRYSFRASLTVQSNLVRIGLAEDRKLESLPFPIFKCFEALFLILDDDSDHTNLLRDAAALKAISNRVSRFIRLLKFDSLDSSQLEKAVIKESDRKTGFIYIAHSPDLERIYDASNVVKIGRSINPLRREIDLTGQMLKEPVSVRHAFRVKDQVLAESRVFTDLARYRFSPAREIFSLSVETAYEKVHKLLLDTDLLF